MNVMQLLVVAKGRSGASAPICKGHVHAYTAVSHAAELSSATHATLWCSNNAGDQITMSSRAPKSLSTPRFPLTCTAVQCQVNARKRWRKRHGSNLHWMLVTTPFTGQRLLRCHRVTADTLCSRQNLWWSVKAKSPQELVVDKNVKRSMSSSMLLSWQVCWTLAHHQLASPGRSGGGPLHPSGTHQRRPPQGEAHQTRGAPCFSEHLGTRHARKMQRKPRHVSELVGMLRGTPTSPCLAPKTGNRTPPHTHSKQPTTCMVVPECHHCLQPNTRLCKHRACFQTCGSQTLTQSVASHRRANDGATCKFSPSAKCVLHSHSTSRRGTAWHSTTHPIRCNTAAQLQEHLHPRLTQSATGITTVVAARS